MTITTYKNAHFIVTQIREVDELLDLVRRMEYSEENIRKGFFPTNPIATWLDTVLTKKRERLMKQLEAL
jgi:hypothetical protein